MGHAELLEDEAAAPNYLIVLAPRRQVSSWTLDSGSVYRADFPYGFASAVAQDDADLSEGSSPTLAAGEFFFDRSTDILYVRMSDNSNPTTKDVTITFEVYVGTYGLAQFRVPTDSTSGDRFYEPVVVTAPNLKAVLSDTLFGYLPVQRTSITMGDVSTNKVFHRIVFDSSFNRATIKIYHWLSRTGDRALDADPDNFRLVFDGLATDDSYKFDSLTLQISDRIDEFSQSYRNTGSTISFYDTTTFPNLNPQNIASPARYVYGKVRGFVPINVDHVDFTTADTGDNRVWSCIAEQVNLANIDGPVTTGSTTTTTVITGLSLGYNIGDRAYFDRNAGTDDFGPILNVSEGGGNTTLTHKDLTGSGGAMSSGDFVRRSFVGAVDVIVEGVTYELQFNRDYTTSGGLAGGMAGFTLTDDFEADHAGLTLFTGDDQILCRIYGPKNNTSIVSHGQLGGDDASTNNLTNPIVVLFDLLRKTLPESSFNTDSFIAEEALVTDALGFAIPSESTGTFPTFRELLLEIARTSLLRFFVDNDLEWTVDRITTLGAASKTIRDDEIITGSFSYKFKYKDLASDVTVSYDRQELSSNAQDPFGASSKVTATSNVAKRLHKAQRELKVDSLHFKAADAQEMADRYIAIFGNRLGKVSLKVKNRFFLELLGGTIKISSPRLPADAVFDLKTEQTRDFVIESMDRGLSETTIGLDDQTGIEGSPGDF